MNRKWRPGSNLLTVVQMGLLLFLLAFENNTPADIHLPRESQESLSYHPESNTWDATGVEMAAPGLVSATATVEVTTAVRSQVVGADPLLLSSKATTTTISHTIEAGQTLVSIAGHYGTTIELIQQLNGIFDPHYLPVGGALVVPVTGWSAVPASPVAYDIRLIGYSAAGYPIEAYVFGEGDKEVVVIGGLHGGYEWNSVLLAYRLMSYFGSQAGAIPEDVQVHIIPAANPDGVVAVTGQLGPFAAGAISADTAPGRLNGNGVDLNRNWGCEWAAEAWWREEAVSAGQRPFSEPETRALRDYLLQDGITVVIWLHSAAGLVAPGGCGAVLHSPSEEAAALYGQASGYPVAPFTAYPVSGDASNWLAQHDIASFTVELSNHQDVELTRNLMGLLAILEELNNPVSAR